MNSIEDIVREAFDTIRYELATKENLEKFAQLIADETGLECECTMIDTDLYLKIEGYGEGWGLISKRFNFRDFL